MNKHYDGIDKLVQTATAMIGAAALGIYINASNPRYTSTITQIPQKEAVLCKAITIPSKYSQKSDGKNFYYR